MLLYVLPNRHFGHLLGHRGLNTAAYLKHDQSSLSSTPWVEQFLDRPGIQEPFIILPVCHSWDSSTVMTFLRWILVFFGDVRIVLRAPLRDSMILRQSSKTYCLPFHTASSQVVCLKGSGGRSPQDSERSQNTLLVGAQTYLILILFICVLVAWHYLGSWTTTIFLRSAGPACEISSWLCLSLRERRGKEGHWTPSLSSSHSVQSFVCNSAQIALVSWYLDWLEYVGWED